MDNKQLTKLISYFVMGDGGLYRNKNSGGYLLNAQFIMNMKEENKDYIDWVVQTLEHVTSVKTYARKDYNTDGYSRKPQLRIESKRLPLFTTIHDRIYTEDGHKGLDMHTLKLLDWEAMAILYMSDGCGHKYLRSEIGMKNSSVNVTLNMKRLSEAEQVVLKKAIKDKLGVEFNVARQNYNGRCYYYLRLRQKDVNTFMDGVLPYMTPSFMYKVVRTESPLKGDDIVCSLQQCEEAGRNDQPSLCGD